MTEMLFAGHPCLGTAFVLGGPLQALESPARDRGRARPGRARARGRAHRLRADVASRCPRSSRIADERELLAALGVERSELPVELYDLGIRHVFVGLARRGRGRGARARSDGSRPTSPATSGAVCFAGEGTQLEGADVRARRRRSRGSGDRVGRRAARGPPRAPRPDRLRRRDRDPSRARRWAVRAMLYARADGVGGRARAGRGRRVGSDRRARRVPAPLGVRLGVGRAELADHVDEQVDVPVARPPVHDRRAEARRVPP